MRLCGSPARLAMARATGARLRTTVAMTNSMTTKNSTWSKNPWIVHGRPSARPDSSTK